MTSEAATYWKHSLRFSLGLAAMFAIVVGGLSGSDMATNKGQALADLGAWLDRTMGEPLGLAFASLLVGCAGMAFCAIGRIFMMDES